MKNIFFNIKEKIPKDHKLKEVFVREYKGVLILEKKKDIIRAKLKQKRRHK